MDIKIMFVYRVLYGWDIKRRAAPLAQADTIVNF